MNEDDFTCPQPLSERCLRHDAHIQEIRSDLKEIKDALMGNEFGQQGILPRLQLVEIKLENHDRKLLVWGSLITACGVALAYIRDFVRG